MYIEQDMDIQIKCCQKIVHLQKTVDLRFVAPVSKEDNVAPVSENAATKDNAADFEDTGTARWMALEGDRD